MSNRPNRTKSGAAARRVAPRPSDSEPSRLPWIIGAAVLVVVVLLLVAVLVSRSSSTTTASLPTGATAVVKSDRVYGEVTVSGTPLPQLPDNGADPAVGMKAPTITSQTFDGKTTTLPAPGKPAVVMFVAHWCPHCRKEVPDIANYLASKGLPTDVNLYAVSTAAGQDKPNYPPSGWLNRENWPVTTVMDDQNQQLANAYGVSGYPFFVVVNAQGNVVARTSGELPIEQFQSLIDQSKSASTGTSVP